MKQIALAVMQYTQDYDEKYPIQRASSSPTAGAVKNFTATSYTNWIKGIYPYVKSWQIFSCPSVDAFNGTAAQNTNYAPVGNSAASYVANGVIFRRDDSGSLSLAAVDEPANIIMVREAPDIRQLSWTRPYETDVAAGTFQYFEYAGAKMDRQHFDGANLAYADGHVKWQKLVSICISNFGVVKPPTGDLCGDHSAYTTAAPRF